MVIIGPSVSNEVQTQSTVVMHYITYDVCCFDVNHVYRWWIWSPHGIIPWKLELFSFYTCFSLYLPKKGVSPCNVLNKLHHFFRNSLDCMSKYLVYVWNRTVFSSGIHVVTAIKEIICIKLAVCCVTCQFLCITDFSVFQKVSKDGVNGSHIQFWLNFNITTTDFRDLRWTLNKTPVTHSVPNCHVDWHISDPSVLPVNRCPVWILVSW